MRALEILRRIAGPLTLIHEQAGPRLLALARRGIFALWMVKLLLDPLSRLAEMPKQMLRPVGVLNCCRRMRFQPLHGAATGDAVVVHVHCAGGVPVHLPADRDGAALHGGGGFPDRLLERDPELRAGGAHGHRAAAVDLRAGGFRVGGPGRAARAGALFVPAESRSRCCCAWGTRWWD